MRNHSHAVRTVVCKSYCGSHPSTRRALLMSATSSLASVVIIAKVLTHSPDAGSFQFSQMPARPIPHQPVDIKQRQGPWPIPTPLNRHQNFVFATILEPCPSERCNQHFRPSSDRHALDSRAASGWRDCALLSLWPRVLPRLLGIFGPVSLLLPCQGTREQGMIVVNNS